ncbi:MAG: GTP-binding protein HflX [Sphingobacteriales bacterium]|jgi:GTP-binding protein HflX
MGKLYDNKVEQEKAVLVGVVHDRYTEAETFEFLDELEFLARTAGADTRKIFTQKLSKPDVKTFVGKGKLEEVRNFVVEENIDMVIFDEELSPSQLRNIERILECKILDRNNLILDIFATRAQTAQAKTQVELAQTQYILPRLTNMWTHLSKQKGGIGMKGPGETEIETDRRIVRDKITLLKKKLIKLDKQNESQRKQRAKMIRVALVGYTNVGKSTLMNLVSKSDVFAENKLFATLDTTVRKVVLGNVPFLLSDTVGFIRKLPHSLIESFKSTLDEVREADILLHVVDISHPKFQSHMDTVNNTLEEIGAGEIPKITIFNKIDAIELSTIDPDSYEADEVDMTNKFQSRKPKDLAQTWIATENAPCIFMSAISKENLEVFRKDLYEDVKVQYLKRYPFEKVFYY